jgi:membrane protein YqaA with SNARE-associated domain
MMLMLDSDLPCDVRVRQLAGRLISVTGLATLGGLFLVAFLAATVFPAQSEAMLAAAVVAGSYPVATLVGVATVGNTLGAVVNWWMGRFAARFKDRRWFPLSEDRFARVEAQYRRWGRWALLLSWMPIIGDALTAAAGALREPLWSFVVIVAAAKGARYVVVALAAAGIMG